jgi:hypothetical protein
MLALEASGRSTRWLAGLMAGSAAMILVSTFSLSHASQRSELFMRKEAGEGEIGYGEGGVGGAYGAWKNSKVVAEGTKHSPLKLDFSAPLDKYTRFVQVFLQVHNNAAHSFRDYFACVFRPGHVTLMFPNFLRLSASEKKYAKGLDYQELAIHTRLDLPEQGYASGFPNVCIHHFLMRLDSAHRLL